MRIKLIFCLISSLGQQIETFDLKAKSNEISIICSDNETISLDGIASIRNAIRNLSTLTVYKCMPLPFEQLTETLGTASENNLTLKKLYLFGSATLEAKHLTGIDEHGVKLVIRQTYLNYRTLAFQRFKSCRAISCLQFQI